MKLNRSLVAAFTASKNAPDGAKPSAKCYWALLRTEGLRFYFTILWELFTTFVIYAPSSDIFKTIVSGPNNKWDRLPEEQRDLVILALRAIDRKGDVSTVINENR